MLCPYRENSCFVLFTFYTLHFTFFRIRLIRENPRSVCFL